MTWKEKHAMLSLVIWLVYVSAWLWISTYYGIQYDKQAHPCLTLTPFNLYLGAFTMVGLPLVVAFIISSLTSYYSIVSLLPLGHLLLVGVIYLLFGQDVVASFFIANAILLTTSIGSLFAVAAIALIWAGS